MDLLVLFGDGAITRKKKLTETLHHALHAMMQFPVIFPGETPTSNIK
jgi:hypothetical protein